MAAVATTALTAVSAGIYFVKRAPTPEPLAFSEFLQQVESGTVTKVRFGERAIDVTLSNGSTVQTIAPPGFLSGNTAFIADLTKRRVRMEASPVADPQAVSYGMIATVALFFGLICFTIY